MILAQIILVMTMMMKSIKTYSELVKLPTFSERFQYAKLDGVVGKATFGYDRYLNQFLYRSKEWRKFRNDIIIRDEGCDLAFPDREINDRIIIHHLNPITMEDIIQKHACVFDPDNVVCVGHMTHEAIHYGDEDLLPKPPIIRKPNDTCPWR